MPKSKKGGSVLPALVAAGVLATGAKMYEGSVKRKVRGGTRIDESYNVVANPAPIDQSYTLLPTETTGAFNPLGNDAVLPNISVQQADFADKQIGGKRKMKKRGGAGGVQHTFPYISLNPAPLDPKVPTNTEVTGGLIQTEYAKADFADRQIGGKRKMKKSGKKGTKKGGDEEDYQQEETEEERVLTVEEQLENCQRELSECQQKLAEYENQPTGTVYSAENEAAGGAKKRKGKKVRGGNEVFPAFSNSPAATEQSLAFNSYDPVPVGPIDTSVASINNSYPYTATVSTAKETPAYVKVGGAKKSRKMKKGGATSNPNMGLFMESNSVIGAEGPKPFPFTDAKNDPLYGGAKKHRKYKGGVNNSEFGYDEMPAMADQSDALKTPGEQVAAMSAVAQPDQAPLTGGAKKHRKYKGGVGSSPVQKGEGAAMADQSDALSLFAGRYVATAAAGKIPPVDGGVLLHGGAKKSRKMKKGGSDERPAIADSIPTGKPADADGRPVVENPPIPVRQFNTDVTMPIGNESQNKAYDALYNANASQYTANTTGMTGGDCGCVAGGAPKKTLKAKIKALAKKLK